MSATATAVTSAPRTDALHQQRMERIFYLIASLLLLALVAIGFQNFYLHGRNSDNAALNPHVAPLLVLHGSLMTLWILLFVTQCSLVVRGNFKLHMSLGVAGIMLATVIFVVGTITGVAAIRFQPAADSAPWGPHRFLVVPLSAIFGFGLLTTIGFLNRRKPAVHRPMLLLATVFIVAAAVDRIPAIDGRFFAATHGDLFGTIYAPTLILAALLFLVKLAMTRRWDKSYLTGYAIIAAISVLATAISATALWDRFAALVRP